MGALCFFTGGGRFLAGGGRGSGRRERRPSGCGGIGMIP